jgi:pyruvate/2-oxoglutarate dehydrogenase complex dihydrolipoamide acyltransferase (E2) component
VLGRNGIRLGSGEGFFDAMKKRRNAAAADSANQPLNLQIKTMNSDGSVSFETLHELLPSGEYDSVTIDSGRIAVNGLPLDAYLEQQQKQEQAAKKQKKEPEQDRPPALAAAAAAAAAKRDHGSDNPVVITIADDEHNKDVREPNQQQPPALEPVCLLNESDLAHDTKEPAESKSTCVGCMENTPRTIFLDCMHQALCIKCARSLHTAQPRKFECVICSKRYKEIRRVFPAGNTH